MTAYKDRKVVKFDALKKFENDGVQESLVTLGSHTGTHVDSPAHLQQSGQTIDKQNLFDLVGDCKVLDMTHVKDVIQVADLEKCTIDFEDIVLLKTSNSFLNNNAPFEHNFVYLDATAARFLALKKIRAVGIDYLGIERGSKEHETHNILFDNNIVLIEGLRLKEATAQEYFFCCLPLLIEGLEAAPARAILFEL